MVPLSSVANFSPTIGPYKVLRYNLYPAADIQGETAPGASTGDAMAAMERLARARLPAGFTYEWTDIAYQQQLAGNSGVRSFILAVVFVFIFLAALYESLTLPLAVILIVPMCLLAAILGVNLYGSDNNILTQIGMVVLIGLAAKNAILIVQFAVQAEQQLGMSPVDAAAHAARTRLRPILMTSVAFIAGGGTAGLRIRRRLGNAPGTRNRGVFWDGRSYGVWAHFHTGVLRRFTVDRHPPESTMTQGRVCRHRRSNFTLPRSGRPRQMLPRLP